MSRPEKERWSRRAVLYHLYPLSFQDSNGDGYGDIQGIIDRLDYLNDGTPNSLGIEAVWLSPIYRSPMADWGYDVADYESIDPIFGDLKLFDKLVAEAHKRGIKVMMDFVPNHTSTEHEWFKESRASTNNPKRDWYIWRDPKHDGSPPNNWLSAFGGSAWLLDSASGQYYLHTFLPEQADLNWRNPAVKEAMLNVLRFWLKRGVDGFRTDAVYGLIKDRELRDDPLNPSYVAGKDDPFNALLHTSSQGQPELGDALASFCTILGEQEDAFLVSEAYLDIPEMLKFYHACESHETHSPFNFNLIGLPWQASAYRQFINKFEAALDANDWPNYVLGNHDRHRLATRLGLERARLSALILLTLRGMPIIYYGDELGMEDGVIAEQDGKDPWGKRVPGFGFGRDPERTPMQWDTSSSADFTTGTPWLPVAASAQERNVATEQADPTSLLALYRHLIWYRKQSPALLTGSYRSIEVGNDNVFAYLRSSENEELLILANFSDSEQIARVPYERTTVVCSSFIDTELERPIADHAQTLRPFEGLVFRLSGGTL
jgi:alpha-glucosidase